MTTKSPTFKHPRDVLNDKTLSTDQKIVILDNWAYDEREKAVAEEENMRGNNGDSGHVLDEILRCLSLLHQNDDNTDSPPTKEG